MTDLPEPLTPPECDLRDFQFMPLDAMRLRDSGLTIHATGEEFRAAVLLWCAAWHQVPAGSLPDDDATLAYLVGLGRALGEWQKIRDVALRGFIKCSDGRLYHGVVAEKAREAWERKEAQRARTAKATEARLAKAKSQRDDAGEDDDEEPPPRNDDVTTDVTPTKGQGQGQGHKHSLTSFESGAAQERDDDQHKPEPEKPKPKSKKIPIPEDWERRWPKEVATAFEILVRKGFGDDARRTEADKYYHHWHGNERANALKSNWGSAFVKWCASDLCKPCAASHAPKRNGGSPDGVVAVYGRLVEEAREQERLAAERDGQDDSLFH